MVKAVERFVVVAPIPGRPMAFGGTVLETLSNSQVVESALTEIPIEQLGEWVESLNAVAIADNLRLQSELSAMTAERDSLATEKTTLTTERDSLQSQVAGLTTSRDDLQTQLTEATTSLDAATGQVEALTTERDSALEQVATLENRIAELTAIAEQPICTNFQIRAWLITKFGLGIIDKVTAMIASIPDATQRLLANQQWEYANNVLRDNPFVEQIAAALGMKSDEMDAAYLEASKIV